MTCIIALRDGQKTWLGGDSAATDGMETTLVAQPKVFVKSGVGVGVCGSPRVLDLLTHQLEIPPPPEAVRSLHKWMVMEFINAVRSCFKAGGVAEKAHGAEQQPSGLLVAVHSKIFHVDTDYQVRVPRDDFDADGCGSPYALGSLATSVGNPRKRILTALTISEHFSNGVRRPFTVICMK